jgi:hypothetical protein
VLKVLFVVALFALATYLIVRLIQTRGQLLRKRPVRRPGLPQRRPFAPDDDPDFLRDLERRRRHPDDGDS